jgi:hypothetical protein
VAPLGVQLAAFQRSHAELVGLLERRRRKFAQTNIDDGERQGVLADRIAHYEAKIADIQAQLAREHMRTRKANGHIVAPPPVMRPLVLAAPRGRRESHRRTRRTASARGDPGQSESEPEPPQGLKLPYWYDRHTSVCRGFAPGCPSSTRGEP